MARDYFAHSDFLVHWTGSDIDAQLEPDWYDSEERRPSHYDWQSPLSVAYADRLNNILRFGLWLTEEPTNQWVVGRKNIEVPPTPKTCFTELKLSESRRHARQYGRLGIGLKRPYVLDRLGRPCVYFGFDAVFGRDLLLESCVEHLADRALLNYFKPMSRPQDGVRYLDYEYYEESEWRVLFREELKRDGIIIDPREPGDREDIADYFESLAASEQGKLKYLLPLDGWLSIIIYPTLGAKNRAQQYEPCGIKDGIARIKRNGSDHANRVERGNWPIETDLNACRHF